MNVSHNHIIFFSHFVTSFFIICLSLVFLLYVFLSVSQGNERIFRDVKYYNISYFCFSAETSKKHRNKNKSKNKKQRKR